MIKGKKLIALTLSFVLTVLSGATYIYAMGKISGNSQQTDNIAKDSVMNVAGVQSLIEPAEHIFPSGLVNNSKTDTAIRAVVDNITELPQYGVAGYTSLYERGTKERPFVILEIVPYEECAEFGYLISGCEPVPVEDMYAQSCLSVINSTDSCKVTHYYVSFFMDEEVITKGYAGLSLTKDESVKIYNGYYEYVGAGNGYLKIKEVDVDGVTKIQMVKDSNGDFIWHTIHDFENVEEYGGALTFTDVIDAEKTYSIGERIYSTRTSGTGSPTANVDYYYYKSKDCFVRDTLGLSEEAAANYSVVFKTITPDELNAKTEWIDYADLIYMSPTNHMNGGESQNTKVIWKNFNRLGHAPTNPDASLSSYRINQFEYNDISYDAVMKIFKKVNADKDYAGLIMDNRLYDFTNSALTTKTIKNDVTYTIYDFNLNATELTNKKNGCSNNVYKLAVMLMGMDSSLFEDIYMDEGYIASQNSGKTIVNTLQSGDAAVYWSGYSFLTVPVDRESPFPTWTYFDSEENWYKYGYGPNLSETKYKSYVKKHVYTYNGNSCSFQKYISGGIEADDNSIYQGFIDYCKILDPEYYETYKKTNANSSDAVRYILNIHESNTGFGDGVTLKVLDIEPSVALDSNSKPAWVLTESFLHMLMPDFRGDFDITHQTTAEFVGRNEDLNSTYNLIYIGLDTGGFNMTSAKQNIYLKNGSYINGYKTDFNDSNLDGKIYFHMGDSMTGTCYVNDTTINGIKYKRTRSVKFLQDVGDEKLRFPGNDISRIKASDLVEYIQSGKPVVTSKYLYNLETVFIDPSSNIYSFVRDYRNVDGENKGVYSAEDLTGVQNAVKSTGSKVTFIEWPAEYNGETESSTSATIKEPNYLPIYGSGNAYLKFTINVDSDNYAYRLYVDQDRDGKFSDGENILNGDMVRGNNTVSYTLSTSMVGLVQWKIEVFEKSNIQNRTSLTRCSAVKVRSDAEKKSINVLQIMPKSGTYNGALNLQTSSIFKKYYNNLNDYNVTVTTITWSDFKKYFVGSNFKFDMSKNISLSNPDTTALQKATDNHDSSGNVLSSELGYDMADLNDYNMIIVGFGDGYGNTDMDNSNGAVEYLQYYTAMGKSILYTHDITSLYNLPSADSYKKPIFGYTANAMMRDLMGMNRYGAVSNQLNNIRANLLNELIAYQTANAAKYDSIDSVYKQGFTYYALKRLGWTESQTSGSNTNKGNKVPFKYMITNPESSTGEAVCTENYESKVSGFNNANDLTTTATKLNEGQITAYPYKISDTLNIASTHGQWYQLNIEDPEVTVWYCLSDPVSTEGADDTSNNRSFSVAKSGNGSALTYGVSPNDAANNYYIYSKGNIFYSGVGHSTVDSDMEAKLFVNTMIAAYRRSYEAPTVEVTAVELAKEEGANQNKTIAAYLVAVSAEEYAADIPETYGDDEYADYIRVYFKLEDMSLSNELSVRISTSGTDEYITKIYTAQEEVGGEAANVLHEASVTNQHYFNDLANDKIYYFYYNKSKLSTGSKAILFESMNDRSSEVGLTYLRLSTQTLFLLD